jgi:serine/threonine-protein kinase RsbW
MEWLHDCGIEVAGAVAFPTPRRLPTLGSFRPLDGFISQIAQVGYPIEFVFAVHLATEEALVNAIRHGNRNDPRKQIRLQWLANRAGVQIEVEDEGAGFNPESVPDPSDDESAARAVGRGLLLMRSLMDQVSHNERGNRVSMVKQRCAVTRRDETARGFSASARPSARDATSVICLDDLGKSAMSPDEVCVDPNPHPREQGSSNGRQHLRSQRYATT